MTYQRTPACKRSAHWRRTAVLGALAALGALSAACGGDTA
jgi:hypothetical protein